MCLIMNPTSKKSRSKLWILVLDLLIGLGFALWLSGGIAWGDRVILRHGADPRRAALILLFASLVVIFRAPMSPIAMALQKSVFVRSALQIAKGFAEQRTRLKVWWGVTALSVLIGVAQALGLRFTMFDVGIFHQVLWGISSGHGFVSTVSGAGNFLLDHLALSLTVLAPAYWISDSVTMLAIIHSLLIWGGVWAWVKSAEKLLPAAAGPTLLFAIGFDSLWANLRWGFHENSVAFFALSWAIYWALTRRIAWVVAALMVFAFSKETLLLCAGMGMFALAATAPKSSGDSRGAGARRKRAIAFSALGAVLMLGFVVYQGKPHPEEKNYFIRYYSYYGPTLGDFLLGLVTQPWKAISSVGLEEWGRYLRTLTLPFLGLCWLGLIRARGLAPGAGPRFWGLVALPSLGCAALATYPPLRQSGFHYVLELWPALVVATLYGLGATRKPEAWAWIWACSSLLMLGQDPIGSLREYGREAVVRTELREKMSLIPSGDSVSASEEVGAWISARALASRFPDLRPFAGEPGGCPKWIILPEAVEAPLAECPDHVGVYSGAGYRIYNRDPD